ncbi:helix-turn-helix domain-containing protein [Sphingosinicella microcystinivorans]|uniref:helix-turn-helix domain-containing protein n=1 Tax=Sphingosinicella microcystinivorans TaxID=335406 RepID=UPI0022F3B48F|nr:XRE family transcriptional regulator [Sphingosinicella microcystinivorans]WBX82723.1 XRE family transcriptional regulator [Sphingosinicella microcystinivorans]
MSTAHRSVARPTPAASPADIDPGEVLRGIRTERGLTLAEVSKRTGMPISTLSKVETGKISLSYEKLIRLSRGLDIDITRLFAAPKAASGPGRSLATGRRTITRAGEGPRIRTATYDYVYPSADLLNKSLNPMIIDVRARSLAEFGDMMRHPGEEYALVLEGQCEFHCDLYAPTLMSTGDSVYFDGSMGHAYVAVGEAPCRILSICSATDADLKSALHPLPKDPA